MVSRQLCCHWWWWQVRVPLCWVGIDWSKSCSANHSAADQVDTRMYSSWNWVPCEATKPLSMWIPRFLVSLNQTSVHSWPNLCQYLGHWIDAQGLHPLLDKVAAVLEAPLPQDVTQLTTASFYLTCQWLPLPSGGELELPVPAETILLMEHLDSSPITSV